MLPIDQAKYIIDQHVFEPKLVSGDMSEKAKKGVKRGRSLVNRFKKVGDLLIYLESLTHSKPSSTARESKEKGYITLDEIEPEIRSRFNIWKDNVSTPNDFIVGQQYDPYDILILARRYDPRASGIMILGDSPYYDGVVIKATLHGKKFNNEWLIPGHELKYYLKSRNKVFKKSYKENQIIIDNPHLPIYTFIRTTPGDPYKYEGTFCYKSHQHEDNGEIWFSLIKKSLKETRELISQVRFNSDADDQFEKSRKLSREERERRLLEANNKPIKVNIISVAYIRNPDVKAAVLIRANGHCEGCKHPAPFFRNNDGTPYLEVHHKIRLADGGDDTVGNALGLCPNCHRKAHYG